MTDIHKPFASCPTNPSQWVSNQPYIPGKGNRFYKKEIVLAIQSVLWVESIWEATLRFLEWAYQYQRFGFPPSCPENVMELEYSEFHKKYRKWEQARIVRFMYEECLREETEWRKQWTVE